ncbi:UDP-glucose 4-epimerase GalE [Aestuariivirga litoralis]|uniref:UDP-glucose 4-epimerase GalE n=1 Tax=Aestuariivirga litoralis TaxID=2650924 RepID=UPI0018C59AEA|nr:UDP-glucose 4-epimerase GalE [Aestuariivirga litoralis]MBG1233131.1 UDP-glucose 4-epimerase GalE [Aestuariivirga litoralis]
MSVLVTGGAGYIGSHMVLALTDAGEDVVVLDNLSTGFAWAIAPGAKLVQGDIGDEELLAKIIAEHKVEAIVHFAGSIIVPESVADPLAYYNNNTVKSRALLAAAVKGGVKKFIFSSTAAVYGNPTTTPVFEDATPAPISPYGTSKLMTEYMLKDSQFAYDFNYVALRYFNVAGADPKGRTGQSTPRATHLIKVACETALGQRASMDVFGTDYPTPDGTCLRDYIHVSDLIAAHMQALKHLRAGGASGIFNCGYGKGYSVLEVIEAVGKANGKPVPHKLVPRRPGDPAGIVAGAQKVRDVLGWKPQYENLDFIVKTALDWEKHLARRNAK